jgi:aminoglycoside phosphotransferase family enzyme/predicted kinase
MELKHLLKALTDQSAYPHPIEAVEVRQTHISAVFLAGPYVYKVKKPVDLGFLDFSTLAKRHHFCEEEVRLNRRLAPHVYLGVAPVVQTSTHLQFEGEGEVVEWAVKMVRLPDNATLQERLARGEVSVALVQTLAQRIAAFHRGAETNALIAAYGRFEGASRIVLDIYDQALPQVGTTASQAVFTRTRALAETALARLRPFIDGRAARGVPRDCHGDLHLDHVYYFPERKPPEDLVIVDCIEFNERFRFIDPVADIAFPVMDLAFFGHRDLAQACAAAYFLASGDEEGRALLPLYTAYRATVRGAVEGMLLEEKEVPEAERAAALQRARAHWLLALTELEEPAKKPCLLLVAGLPGIGKSWLARALAEHSGFRVIASDVVRKELAGMSGHEQLPPPVQESIYTAEWNERTYAECLRRAEHLLFKGYRVLVDATFREEKRRQTFLDAAVRWGVPAGILHCEAGPETVRRRLAERQGGASDADWSVYLQLAGKWEKFGPKTGQACHSVCTEGSAEEVLSQALEGLRRFGVQE